MWTAIGNLGDAALTLPLAAVCFAWLTRSLYGWRIALSWATLLAAAMLLVGVTKILHAGCGVQIRAVHFRAISGHALLAAAVWPMACLLMLHDGWNTRTLRALLPGLALAATIAVARARDAHTASEVMAGWMLGVLVTVVLLKRWTDAPILPPVLRPLAVVSVCAVAALAYGRHAAIQDAIDVYAPVVCARGCERGTCAEVAGLDMRPAMRDDARGAARSRQTIGGTDQHSVGLARLALPTMGSSRTAPFSIYAGSR
jgi:hypothetical protein